MAARKRKVIKFPDQVLDVPLDRRDRMMVEHFKKLYGIKTDTGLFRRILREYAETEGIRPKRKRKRKEQP